MRQIWYQSVSYRNTLTFLVILYSHKHAIYGNTAMHITSPNKASNVGSQKIYSGITAQGLMEPLVHPDICLRWYWSFTLNTALIGLFALLFYSIFAFIVHLIWPYSLTYLVNHIWKYVQSANWLFPLLLSLSWTTVNFGVLILKNTKRFLNEVRMWSHPGDKLPCWAIW